MDPLLNLTLQGWNVSVSGIENTEGTWCKRQTDRLLGNSGPVIHTFYGTDEMRHIFTSLVTCILLTTGMNLKWQTRILADYGRYETCLKFWMAHFPNFTTLPKICLLAKLLFPSKEGWFSASTYQRNASISASKFQTLWLGWIHVWHESILGEG